MTAVLMPMLSPTPDTFVVGTHEFRLGEEVVLLPDEAAKLAEIVELFRALRTRLDGIYHVIHEATRSWMPSLHADYHAYQRMYAAYRRAQEDLVWAVQDRIGAALPVGLDVISARPRMFIRSPLAEDAPSLSVQDVAQRTMFQRRAAEARALAMALNDAFTAEDGVQVTFSLEEWDACQLTILRTKTPTWLLDAPAPRAAALERCLNGMLTEGAVGRMMIVRNEQQPQIRILPTMLLIVGDEYTAIASFAGMTGWTADADPDGEMRVARHVLTTLGLDTVRHFGLLRHVRVLPSEALQENADAPKKTGFVYTHVEAATGQCTSDALVIDIASTGALVCRLRRSVPNAVLGSLLTPDELRALLAP